MSRMDYIFQGEELPGMQTTLLTLAGVLFTQAVTPTALSALEGSSSGTLPFQQQN